MIGEFKLSDFDPNYIRSLQVELINILSKYCGWVEVKDLAVDTTTFVNAVVTLGECLHFDDAKGRCRIEFNHDCSKIRFIPDEQL